MLRICSFLCRVTFKRNLGRVGQHFPIGKIYYASKLSGKQLRPKGKQLR